MTQPDPIHSGSVPADDGPVHVARGTRREETHYETDPGQGVRVSHTFTPAGPLPADEQTDRPTADAPGAPMQELNAVASSPSVWEASPDKPD
jgi:hypothetical protein